LHRQMTKLRAAPHIDERRNKRHGLGSGAVPQVFE
jgi:hypothetical protein